MARDKIKLFGLLILGILIISILLYRNSGDREIIRNPVVNIGIDTAEIPVVASDTQSNTRSIKDTLFEIVMPPDPVDPLFYEEPVFAEVQEEPRFPGGESGLMEYFSDNFIYPQMEREYGIEYRGNLILYIDRTGMIEHMELIPKDSSGIYHEIKRVVKKMPRFIPAKNNGISIPSQVTIPLNLKISED